MDTSTLAPGTAELHDAASRPNIRVADSALFHGAALVIQRLTRENESLRQAASTEGESRMPTTIPIVTLTREQRDVFCSFAWGGAHDSTTCDADPDDEFRYYMGIYRLVDRLQWQSDEPERDLYELPVDESLRWVMAYRIMPDVELFGECLAEEAAMLPRPVDDRPPTWWRAEQDTRQRTVTAVTDAIQAVMAEVA